MLAFTRPSGSRHLVRSIHHGHTTTTRRQLAAWDTAVQAWRLLLLHHDGAALAARAWEFLTSAGAGYATPADVAHGR